MAQFDVFLNPNRTTKKEIPYFLEIQSNFLSSCITMVVVPLIPKQDITRPIKYINPIFEIESEQVVMLTQELAGVQREVLGKKVMSLQSQRYTIMQAFDFLITGV